MPSKPLVALALVAVLAACQQQPAAPAATENIDGNAVPTAPPAAVPALRPSAQTERGVLGTPGGPDDQTPQSEPERLIDPKSAAAAGQVLQSYGALVEAKKFGEARALWGDGGSASGMTPKQFVAAYAKYRDIRAEVGKPGAVEGAAGSSFVEIPFRLYGRLRAGGRFNMVGPVTLRRVNDVDGSTAEQRRWHIASSGLKRRP